MSDYFIFGENDDAVDTRAYNAQVYRRNIVTMHPYQYNSNEIPGGNGDIFIPLDRFPNYTERYQVVINSANAESDSDAFINALFAKRGYQTLKDSFDTSVYTIAVLNSQFDIETVRERDVFKMNIEFNRKPQRFLNSGRSNIAVSSGDILDNPTNFPSKPRIFFKGNGTMTFSNGGNSYYFDYDGPGDTGYICVDCESMECYQWAYQQNRNTYLELGDNNGFPMLHPNGTIVSITEDMTDVLIAPRWWKI